MRELWGRHVYRRYERDFCNLLSLDGVKVSHEPYTRVIAQGKTNAFRLLPTFTRPKGLVVFAHEAGYDALFPQLSLLRSLALHGFEVFTFDLDGHGHTSTTVLTDDVVRDCVGSALDMAIAGSSFEVAHLLGVGVGGALCLKETAQRKHRVKSLIAVATPLKYQGLHPRLLKELYSLCRPAFYHQNWLLSPWELVPPTFGYLRDSYPVRLEKRPLIRKKTGYLRVISQLLSNLHLEQTAGEIDTPSMFIYADGDGIVAPRSIQRLARWVEGSKKVRIHRETHYTLHFSLPCHVEIIHWLQNSSNQDG